MGIGRRKWAAFFAVAVMGATAGCAGSDGGAGADGGPSAPAPVADARRMSESLTLLKGYRSLGLKGEVRGEVPRTVDLHADRHGNCVGTYEELGATNEVVVIGDRGWVLYGDKKLESSRTFAKTYAPDQLPAVEKAIEKARGKYVEYPAHEVLQYPGLNLCDLGRAFAKLPGTVSSAEEKGNPRAKGGERTVQLTHGSGGDEVSVHVPEKAGSVPRGIDFVIGDAPALLELGDYDEPVRVKPPNRADIVSAEEVKGMNVSVE
ncbi:hypothetical protein [Streptomyces sp. Wh19]|uniref:Lipoprotein n=1 Tax=Streptomyces sanglieri TaxID=193460 RepID=A0ABW2X2K4_9ACTN|nr:hypothetical protein [Streptomyces sp. Wh19]MDV9201437.1 hypothetical protein [Streptomyces sp. Wh19]